MARHGMAQHGMSRHSQLCFYHRRFLLEWLSFLYRYVPVGLLEVVPQVMQWRPPAFCGRSDLETLLARYPAFTSFVHF